MEAAVDLLLLRKMEFGWFGERYLFIYLKFPVRKSASYNHTAKKPNSKHVKQ